MDNRAIWRGKHYESGEWLYGFLMMPVNRPHEELSIQSIEPDKHGIRGFAEVDPSTLGQCTGLCATIVDGEYKDGKFIFEDDIIGIFAYSYHEAEDEIYGVIGYFGGNLGVRDRETNKITCLCECEGSYITHYEIYGNIHDNPSLLEGVEA